MVDTTAIEASGVLGVASAFEAIVRCTHDAVIATTVAGTVTVWNDGASRLYGFTPEEMLGRSVELLCPPSERQLDRERRERAAGGTVQREFRCVRVRADGETVAVVETLSPVLGPEGDVIGLAGLSRPVTSAEPGKVRFTSLLAAAPDAMICVDRDGRIATVNAQVGTLFGYAQDELIGAQLEILLPDSLRAQHVTHRARYLEAPRVRSMGSGLSLLARRRDGSEFPVEVSLAFDEVGGDGLVIAAVRDVSEQRALQARAKENENRLRQLAESVDVVFVLLQLEPPAYLYVSPGAERLVGDAVVARGADPRQGFGLVHPDDRHRVEFDYLAAARLGLPAESEHRIVRPDGEVRWVRATASPVRNPDERVLRTVLTLEDVTERVRVSAALRDAEASARAANESKNQFLSRMSHELRTPLNAVLGFGQLLSRQLAGTEHAESIDHVLKGGRHLLELINDVLDIARIESGQMSISQEPVPVAPLVLETLQLMEPLAADAGVTLVAADMRPGAQVLADRQRLRQVLLNLVSNGIKYNHRGGQVRVEVEDDGSRTALTVRDDGQGIAPELVGRLFTAFDRLGAEGSEVEGSGIGLALTRSLADLMGGSVTVTSTLHLGSAFTVWLPTARAPVQPAGDPDETAAGDGAATAPTRVATVLYVEDNDPNVKVMQHLLRLRPGWRLIHAGLGRLGVDLARAHHPDLVLLDLHLPDLTGLEVLKVLKGHPATAGIPVVILTADASPGQPRLLRDAGAERFLTKPLDVDDVLQALDAVTTRPGHHEQ